MIDKAQWWEFGQDTGVTPLLFTRSAMGFLMTTESQDLGLTSHPKDRIVRIDALNKIYPDVFLQNTTYSTLTFKSLHVAECHTGFS